MHKSAYESAERFIGRFLNLKQELSIIDIGSYDVNGCVRPLFQNPLWKYTGLDLVAGPNVDLVVDAQYSWNIPDNTYDVAVSLNTMEHVRQPWNWINEVIRIIKPGGLIFLCVPHTIQFHEHPIDCWRIWPDGMKGLFEHANLIQKDIYSFGIDTIGIGIKK